MELTSPFSFPSSFSGAKEREPRSLDIVTLTSIHVHRGGSDVLDSEMNIAICRLMGLAFGPQLPPPDVESVIAILTESVARALPSNPKTLTSQSHHVHDMCMTCLQPCHDFRFTKPPT